MVIPARNEERWIGACIQAIRVAARRVEPAQVEVIVVLNRCTDATEGVARRYGARIVGMDGKNLSAVRNAGARAATGDILITIDADSLMSPNTFVEVERRLHCGKFIGGGAMILPERLSPGILVSGLLVAWLIVRYRVSAGMFWLRREDFEAIGGFDESLVSVEDLDLATRLRTFGRARGQRFGTLWRTPITTSCRKFDHFGDWFLLRNLWLARALLGGRDARAANLFFYDFPR